MHLNTNVSFKDKSILVIAPHPDDDVIGCGACLFYLSKLSKNNKPSKVTIAYATNGVNGVSNNFLLQDKKYNLETISDDEKKKIKIKVREQEARKACAFLDAQPVFLNLPFYQNKKKNIELNDIEIVYKFINLINPDVIFVIDEENDPHGTHGLVREVFLQVLEEVYFDGLVFGYRVWGSGYKKEESAVIFEFDEDIMAQKERLILCHESQIKKPAFPHEKYDFVTMVKRSNNASAKNLQSEHLYIELYKRLRP